jgi:hypothetical protein
MNGHRVAAVLLGSALALTGCGGGDDEAAPESPATVTQTVTATPSASTEPSTSPPSSPSGLPSIQVPTASFPGSATPSSGSSANVSRPPRNYLQALEHISAAEAANPTFEQAGRWQTPSGNIFCVLGSDVIPPSCELAEGAIRDPAVCGRAPTQFVGRIEIRGDHARAVCNTDTIRGPGRWVTIDYGTVVGNAKVICVSEEIGVTCVSTSLGGGFFLRRGEYHLFR